MAIRVVAVLAVSLVCTQTFGLGVGSVFATVAVGNAASAVVMVVLYLLTERRLRPSGVR
jgi:hypothetical protein